MQHAGLIAGRYQIGKAIRRASKAFDMDKVTGLKIRGIVTPVPVRRGPANLESVNRFDAVSLANLQLHVLASGYCSFCVIGINKVEGVAQKVVAMDRINRSLALPALAAGFA
jgi:hypothetical protein